MHLRTPAALIALLWIVPLQAQEKREDSNTAQYKVELQIQDNADTAAKGTRRYTMMIDTNGKGTFRVGNRIPYVSGSYLPGQKEPAATQYQYVDVGVNIDTRLRDAGGGKVSLNSDIEISALVQKPAGATVSANPTISSLRMTLNTVMAPGEPVLVASVDDPITMRKFDVEATVTKVN